jgi:hypothetical protein
MNVNEEINMEALLKKVADDINRLMLEKKDGCYYFI